MHDCLVALNARAAKGSQWSCWCSTVACWMQTGNAKYSSRQVLGRVVPAAWWCLGDQRMLDVDGGARACRLTVHAYSWQPSNACREARLGVQQETGGVPQGLDSIGITFIGDVSLCLAWDSDSFAPTCWAVLKELLVPMW